MRAPEYPTVKIGKVVGMHQADHSVDVAFLSGGLASWVPVMSGWAATAAGIAHLTTPSINQTIPTAPTYNQGELGLPIEPIVPGPFDCSHVAQPINDVYAVCMQFEGHQEASSRYICLGFIYPQVTEMMFPQAGLEENFRNLWLFRHESDMQWTVDNNGNCWFQHAGLTPGTTARMGFGGMSAINGTDTKIVPVDLTGLDYDGLYKLTQNAECPIGFNSRDTAGTNILFDPVAGSMQLWNDVTKTGTNQSDLLIFNGDGTIQLRDQHQNTIIIIPESNTIIIRDAAQDEIILTNGLIVIQNVLQSSIIISETAITATDTLGDVIQLVDGTIVAQDVVGDKVIASGGALVAVDAAGDNITLADGAINISAQGVINLSAPVVNINSDSVNVIPGGGEVFE